MNTAEQNEEVIDAFLRSIVAFEDRRGKAITAGIAALHRLVEVAKNDHGQAITCRLVLLGLYNGHAWPFPLTDLRGLDVDLFDDCMAVIAMDAAGPIKEVHEYIKGGDHLFQRWAREFRNAAGRA